VTGRLRWATVAWERRAAGWADAIVCVSRAERDRGRDAGIAARYRVVPNGVDVRVLTPASEDERRASRARLGLDLDAPLAVCVARLSPQKGQDLLLEAWPAVRRAVPGAVATLVGDGPDLAALRSRGVEGVRFFGPSNDVPAWLAAADVVVQPSRWEGMALILLEAMARGRSVVAAAADGVRESLADDAGAIVPIGDPGSLATAIIARLLDPALASAEGTAGRARAERFHDVRASRDAMSALTEEIVQRRPGRPVQTEAGA
jgi:glycosyltransferase involved in cell wall biosynthesis